MFNSYGVINVSMTSSLGFPEGAFGLSPKHSRPLSRPFLAIGMMTKDRACLAPPMPLNVICLELANPRRLTVHAGHYRFSMDGNRPALRFSNRTVGIMKAWVKSKGTNTQRHIFPSPHFSPKGDFLGSLPDPHVQHADRTT